MDIIANARTVGCIVVITEDREALKLSYRNLGNIRNQIVWNALRVFTNNTALMGTDWIKVAQKHHIPFSQIEPLLVAPALALPNRLPPTAAMAKEGAGLTAKNSSRRACPVEISPSFIIPLIIIYPDGYSDFKKSHLS